MQNSDAAPSNAMYSLPVRIDVVKIIDFCKNASFTENCIFPGNSPSYLSQDLCRATKI